LGFNEVFLKFKTSDSHASDVNSQQAVNQDNQTKLLQSKEVSQNPSQAAETVQMSSSQNSDTYTNSIGMEFVKIPAGEFMMGSPSDEKGRDDDEGLAHKVTIGDSYYLGKFEVTQKQWKAVMGDNPPYFRGDDLPVGSVSWNDVQEFIKKLNEKEWTDKYRLPSDA
jgi:formylglycine-generating enzyme required for sulfatase activity